MKASAVSVAKTKRRSSPVLLSLPPCAASPAASSRFFFSLLSLFHRGSDSGYGEEEGFLLPATPRFTDRLTDGTNNGVKFIRLHIGAIKRQTDRQSSEREARTKEGLILNIIYLPG